MKKTKLVVDFDYDFELLGITSAAKFYKLAWAINNQLHINLIKKDDYIILDKDERDMGFGHYYFGDESNSLEVFKNKSTDMDNSYLIPEMTHYDYIIKLKGTSQTFAVEEVLKELREVKYIEYIAGIDAEQLKSRDNFLS